VSLHCLWSILSRSRNWNNGFSASYSSIKQPYCRRWKSHPNHCFLRAYSLIATMSFAMLCLGFKV
jgi:hypothetical protein